MKKVLNAVMVGALFLFWLVYMDKAQDVRVESHSTANGSTMTVTDGLGRKQTTTCSMVGSSVSCSSH